jgi:Cytochrome c3
MARKLQPGTPSRSPRYVTPTSGRRLVTFSIGGAALALIVGVVLFATGVRTVASPGDVVGAHSTIDGRCAQCHEPAKAVTDVRCERCHDPLSARRYAAPAHAALGGSAWRAAHAESLACGSCHAEHRGRDAVLSRVADQSCTSCHGFGSFRRHPEIAAVRAGHDVEPGLDFSHEIHLREVAKIGGDRCQACHQSTDNQAGFEPIDFDRHSTATMR